MNTKTILLTSAFIAFLFWLFRKKGVAATPPDTDLKLKADWSANKFKVTHPSLGSHTITNPASATVGAANHLATNSQADLYWNLVPGNRFVITLFYNQGPVKSEAYIIDLGNQEAEYHRELREAIVTA